MRTFLALELPGEFKEELAKAIRELQVLVPHGVKWVMKDNLHITMLFIGDVGPGKISELKSEFQAILKDLKSFAIDQPQIEVISIRNPRLVWVKCNFISPELPIVVDRIRQYLEKEGFEIDKKPFRLHITLGRIKKTIENRVVENLFRVDLRDKRWTVSEATFYESRLLPEGPEYSKIATFNLQEVK